MLNRFKWPRPNRAQAKCRLVDGCLCVRCPQGVRLRRWWPGPAERIGPTRPAGWRESATSGAEPAPPPPVAVIKKPVPIVVKPTPVTKPKETVVAKVDKPAPKQTVAKETKPVPVSAGPVIKQNIPLPVQNNAAVDVAKRSINSEQSLFYKSDSLQITLYDNGEIDGDTVSVLLNGKVIIAKKGLDTKPNSYTIYFDRSTPDSQMLVMYAENLGSIPPNTGLLVVREGPSVYELRFSADLKTNAAIILRRKKE